MAVTVIIVVFILFLSFFNNSYYLVIKGKDHKILRKIPVNVKQDFSILFIHSSELEPWENIFYVNNDGRLVLKEIRVSSTGPGVPSVLEQGWKASIRDGCIIYHNVNKEYESIDFVVSPISPHYLKINGQRYNLVEIAGEWAQIKIYPARRD
ncbi:MAG: DUF1850 domain-containing protein [Firmicutes bacterium]|nr:DUF1850 domain-containing protein [Bacillota bacterium]